MYDSHFIARHYCKKGNFEMFNDEWLASVLNNNVQKFNIN